MSRIGITTAKGSQRLASLVPQIGIRNRRSRYAKEILEILTGAAGDPGFSDEPGLRINHSEHRGIGCCRVSNGYPEVCLVSLLVAAGK